ncbi:hypothetical protein UFOVP861_45 [uncultured Caudovirales phage]|uniref:Uncharacterized protein n=1 Tax=uncultured Caudovirales phage TaxID=2100421 RepID=A0A6J5P907_9CAUD|nr:hypothetical protein UFOVP861_45 [uncultured Caudovirales phage]
MASQVASIKSAILDACGLSDITDADTNQQATMLRAVNAAIQIISTYSPSSWHRTDEWTGYLRSPTAAALTGMALGAKTFAWASLSSNLWALNNAIIIDGDTAINRLQRRGVSSTQLMLPYLGSTASNNATIYNDIIETPDDFIRMKGDVAIIGKERLIIAGSNDQLGQGDQTVGDVIFGEPSYVRLVSRYNSSGARRPHLKLDTLPTSASRIYIEYYARPLDVASFDEDRQDLVPMGYVDSILIPVVIQKLSEFSTLVSDSRIPGNSAAYAAAMQTLADLGDTEGSTAPGKLVNELY